MPSRPRRSAAPSLPPVLALAIALAVALGCVPALPDRTRPPIASVAPSEDPGAAPSVDPGGPASPTPSARPSFVRPTPTPQPTFLAYVVRPGDTLTSIARAHATTAQSIAFWNREAYPSLDPDAPEYEPDRIEAGWVLRLVPGLEVDPDDFL
jgi:LysM domain